MVKGIVSLVVLYKRSTFSHCAGTWRQRTSFSFGGTPVWYCSLRWSYFNTADCSGITISIYAITTTELFKYHRIRTVQMALTLLKCRRSARCVRSRGYKYCTGLLNIEAEFTGHQKCFTSSRVAATATMTTICTFHFAVACVLFWQEDAGDVFWVLCEYNVLCSIKISVMSTDVLCLLTWYYI